MSKHSFEGKELGISVPSSRQRCCCRESAMFSTVWKYLNSLLGYTFKAFPSSVTYLDYIKKRTAIININKINPLICPNIYIHGFLHIPPPIEPRAL